MRTFFAVSIGVQVPIKDLIDGKVIGTSVLFTLSLIGKLAIDLIVPNLNNVAKFRGLLLRDYPITNLSMVSEGSLGRWSAADLCVLNNVLRSGVLNHLYSWTTGRRG